MINAKFLVKITNRSHRDEIKEPTFHLEHRIIARRLRYLQDILHNVGGQYAEQQAAVRAQLEMRIDGNITTGMEILDNFPKHITWTSCTRCEEMGTSGGNCTNTTLSDDGIGGLPQTCVRDRTLARSTLSYTIQYGPTC